MMAGRILIADDMATNRIILKARLNAAAYQTQQVSSGAEAIQQVRSSPPDVILVAQNLPDIDGIALCQRLRASLAALRTPIILMTSDRSRDTRLAALKAGADVVMDRLPDDTMLRARIRNLQRRSAAEQEFGDQFSRTDSFAFTEPAQAEFTIPGQIALIAPSLSAGLKWRNGLGNKMRDHIAVLDPEHALIELDNEPSPDAVVIAENPDHPDHAMEVIADLRSRPATLRTAIVVVQDTADVARAVAALDLGVNELVDEGFDPSEIALLLRRVLARKAMNDSHREALQNSLHLASTDPLTGLFNRRYALDKLDKISRSAPQNGETYAVMVLDLDRFKRINDLYGHATGDAVLQEISARMAGCLRRNDFLARIGGEEFLAVIRTCDLVAAQKAAERLRKVVADTPVTLPGDNGKASMTVSIGVVMGGDINQPGDPAALVDLADRGLYVAKADGRNQVTVCETAA